MTSARIALGLVALLAAAGCETTGGARDPSAPDGTGYRVVGADDGRPRAVPWTLGSSPSLVLGGGDAGAAHGFVRVVGALRLGDDRVVVADGRSGELRFFAPDGAFLMRTGGVGEGAGQFERLRGIDRCSTDGFVAFDLGWEIHHYAPDGTLRAERELIMPSGSAPYHLACDAERVAAIGYGFDFEGPPPRGLFETRDHLMVWDASGAVLADLGERLVSDQQGTRSGSSAHPFGRATVFALHGGRLYVGDGERLEVKLYGLDGALHTVVRGPSGPLEVTDSLKAALLESRLAGIPPERRPAIRQRHEEMAWPEERAAFTALRVDPEGLAWLRRPSVRPDEAERWALLDPEAGYLGELELAAGRTLLRPERDEVLVLERDAAGVERVLALPLDRAGP